MYLYYEHTDNKTYAIKADNLKAMAAAFIIAGKIKRLTKELWLSYKEVYAKSFSCDKIEYKKDTVNLLGMISVFNISKDNFVLVEFPDS